MCKQVFNFHHLFNFTFLSFFKINICIKAKWDYFTCFYFIPLIDEKI